MAQTEDTELRDLVIESLERNGSLAKIRALLRANIFLAFEDENLKQNVNLDNILKLPEGTLALSIVHEFLEFCNLKNTLFVYMSESRQGNDYNYDGKKALSEKLHISKCDNTKEPLLVTLLKSAYKLPPQKKYYEQSDNGNFRKHDKCADGNYRDEENCTYIVHEDSQSSNTSNSHSDNSSTDEKNKLHLRLHLDNSDTDTSSDSARDKTSSEYIPGDHIINPDCKNGNKITVFPQNSGDFVDVRSLGKSSAQQNQENIKPTFMAELKLSTNSSSDSTSYIDLKPFNSLDEKMLNTAGLPVAVRNEDIKADVKTIVSVQNKSLSKNDSEKSGTLSTVSPVSAANESRKNESNEKKSQESGKSDGDTGEYSFDFTPSPVSKHQERAEKRIKSTESVQDVIEKFSNKNSPVESPHQVSRSSQSSVSLSDVADLISEKSFVSHRTSDKSNGNKSNISRSNNSKEKTDSKQNKLDDDSGDFTESPVPSLSNLSLDIHSD